MNKSKVVVFCLDALCTGDLEYMATLPNFKKILDNGALVKHVEPVYPSLTYPCHCSIITGNTIEHHGIDHNEMVEVENAHAPWYTVKGQMKNPVTLLDQAKAHGYTTCSVFWPVSGDGDYDINLPMIVPVSYSGDDAYQFFKDHSTQEILDRYFWKYEHYLAGEDTNSDEFTLNITLDILEDYGQYDIMLVKMCDLDTVKHTNGVFNDAVKAQLRKHDRQLGILMEGFRRFGDYDNTHFVILGDHGQADVKRHINFNMLLRDHGFITTDENNQLVDWKAYCHSASMSGWIELKDKHDDALREAVYQFLKDIAKDPQYNIGTVLTAKQAKDQYHLVSDHIDFVIEGNEPMSFDSTLEGRDLFQEYLKPGWHHSLASHGYQPEKDETTTFIVAGPNVKPGVTIERSTILNEAPTMAALMGFTMENVDGTIWHELIKE